MRVTIIPADHFIRRDNVSVRLSDWPFDDADIHAIQWYGEEGEVEYSGHPKPPNQVISDSSIMGPYLAALDENLPVSTEA